MASVTVRVEPLLLACVFVLSVWSVVGALDLWFKGSLFDRPRAAFGRMAGRGRRLGELMTCRFCLSHWAALSATACALPVLPSDWLAPVWWLALRRCAGYVEAMNDWLSRRTGHHEFAAGTDDPEEAELGERED